jgi:hypothetical protein
MPYEACLAYELRKRGLGHYRVGLLINFNVFRLKDGIVRKVQSPIANCSASPRPRRLCVKKKT